MGRPSQLEVLCARWWVRPLTLSSALVAIVAADAIVNADPWLEQALYLLASITIARYTGSPLIASSLYASSWYGDPSNLPRLPWPLPPEAPLYAGMAAAAAVAISGGAWRGEPLEPSLEHFRWARLPQPTPLAAAAIAHYLLWRSAPISYGGQELLASAWTVLGAVAAASTPVNPRIRIALAVISSLGPAGSYITLVFSASAPYCYRCPEGESIEGTLVAAAARTSRLRGFSRLSDGRVVACARGRPARQPGPSIEVGSVSEMMERGVLPAEQRDPLIRGFITSGGLAVYPGCRDETLLVKPQGKGRRR